LDNTQLLQQGIWSVLIGAAAVAVPAVLGFYYFAAQRRWERATVTNALRSEIRRLRLVLEGHLRWIDKPEAYDLPLIPFDTALFDAHLDKIGMLESTFAECVVPFYGTLHFINALQQARSGYYQVNEGRDHFARSYKKAIHKAITYVPPDN
jgi:hypothetical protein